MDGYTVEPQNMDVSESSEVDKPTNGEKKPFWRVQGPGAIRKKKKRSPAEKNLRLKKYVQPKNAVMCLNELVQHGTPLKFDQEGSNETGMPICMTVEVNGQKYRGFGSSKQNAKQAAAEAALVSFVQPPSTVVEDNDDDKTPWAVLASFAMYKLFNEWREGRIGVTHSGTSISSFSSPMVQDNSLAQTFQKMLGKSIQFGKDDEKTDTMKIVSQYLGKDVNMKDLQTKGSKASKAKAAAKEDKKPAAKEDDKKVPNPAKTVPSNAATVHPVMLLHQMRPNLIYIQATIMKNDQQVFTVSCDVDGQKFVGEGINAKKAKFDLAVKANKKLFDVTSTYKATS